MTMSTIVLIVSNLILNVATVYGVVYAATYFNKPSILWFLLLPFLNGLSIRSKDDKEDEHETEH